MKSKHKTQKVLNSTFEQCFYYKIFIGKEGFQYWMKIGCVLMLPYLLIAILYMLINPKSLAAIQLDFWFELTIASSWFIIGPHLVFSFIKSFIGLSNNAQFTKGLQAWFKTNAKKHYHIYKRYMVTLSPVFLALAIPVLLYNPTILTKTIGISTGYADPFFWLIVVFLLWFLVYCTNAIAVIALLIHIIKAIKNEDVLAYSPTDISHHKSIKELLGFSNKVVSYMCSGLVFLPIAFFFLRQQAYIYWVTALLVFYGSFLFAAISYPKATIKAYTTKKASEFLLDERLAYLKNISADKSSPSLDQSFLAKQFQRYNAYLYLQELKTICSLKIGIDKSVAITYLSIFATLLTSTKGIIELVKLLYIAPTP